MMKMTALLLLISSTLLGTPMEEFLTDYYARQTLQEVVSENAPYDDERFDLHEHALFFSELDKFLLQETTVASEPRTLCPVHMMEAMDTTSKKLRKSMNTLCKKNPSASISAFLKKWASFHFSKEEKDTLAYFMMLKKDVS